METTNMKRIGMIGTAVLSLALGVAAPAYAQEQHEQQEEQKARPAQQEEKQAQPAAKQEERNAQQQDKNAKQEEKNTQQQDKNNKSAEKNAQQQDKNNKSAEKNAQQENKNNQQEERNAQQRTPQVKQPAQHAGGRIPDDRFKANFGRQHSFHVSQAEYSNGRRFQYGGYSFGFVDAWPSNWLYTQDVYVIEINGVYYLCNPMYPGINIALSFEL
jgi:outer membrane biosynthesis protein TonB